MTATDAAAALQAYHNPVRAEATARFFKTGPGQYGEGDMFWGTTVPVQRKVAKQYNTLPLAEAVQLLQSPIHDCRLSALFILVAQYRRGTSAPTQAVFFLRGGALSSAFEATRVSTIDETNARSR
jgi:hypothetical protein